jgi:hypothetical protein
MAEQVTKDALKSMGFEVGALMVIAVILLVISLVTFFQPVIAAVACLIAGIYVINGAWSAFMYTSEGVSKFVAAIGALIGVAVVLLGVNILKPGTVDVSFLNQLFSIGSMMSVTAGSTEIVSGIVIPLQLDIRMVYLAIIAIGYTLFNERRSIARFYRKVLG